MEKIVCSTEDNGTVSPSAISGLQHFTLLVPIRDSVFVTRSLRNARDVAHAAYALGPN
jgi:hypothetical protein